MTVTREQLVAVKCDFPTDRVADPEMTAFKQEARYRQHQWAVSTKGIAEFGSHGNTKRAIKMGKDPRIPNGTKLTASDAEEGKNFLSDEIREAVQHRIDHPQKYQTFDVARLRGDLLSSMPMAFNLFGEASRQEESKQALARLLAPDAKGPIDIVFEWSPERRSLDYTRDRTAFDVAIRIGEGPRTVIGIETKYHEHSTREKKPTAKQLPHYEEQTEFLLGKAEKSGVFANGWQDKVLTTDLRQIWRDHLLALSMREHAAEWTSSTRYVLIYPHRNVSYRDAVTEYGSSCGPATTPLCT